VSTNFKELWWLDLAPLPLLKHQAQPQRHFHRSSRLEGPAASLQKRKKKVKRNPFKNSRKRKEKEEEGKKLN